jgi:hypothetical protein
LTEGRLAIGSRYQLTEDHLGRPIIDGPILYKIETDDDIIYIRKDIIDAIETTAPLLKESPQGYEWNKIIMRIPNNAP